MNLLRAVARILLRRRRGKRRARVLPLLALALFAFAGVRCASARSPRPPGKPIVRTLETTGYCNCGECCSWKRSWFGLGPAVYTSGKLKGKIKKIGITASGTKAKRGTIAADTSRYPMGTVMRVDGYGWGTVEDRGGDIIGDKIDLWHKNHRSAKKWGRKKIKVEIWLPAGAAVPGAAQGKAQP